MDSKTKTYTLDSERRICFTFLFVTFWYWRVRKEVHIKKLVFGRNSEIGLTTSLSFFGTLKLEGKGKKIEL